MSLADSVLKSDEIEKADRLSKMLVESKANKETAINELRCLIGEEPKRPLFYANYELKFLPHWTRNSVRYLGDYIDQLCKHWAYICTQNEDTLKGSMGKSLTIIKKSTGEQYSNLTSVLEEFNRVFYVPAKHDFTLPEERKEHRITSKEVVYTVFITINIGHRIRDITKCVQNMECHNGNKAKHTV